MTHGSLFSGIGGFDLAAEWMGWENVFHCEWNPFGQKLLKHYWPNSISYNDITKTNFTIHAGAIDVLTGGFPCQPYSAAGKRLGKEDERHLWPEMLRAIREISPRYVVGENVRGLTNWNGGLVFDEVQADLEAAGYEVLPFLLPAAGVGAPHRRDRIWFVAYSGLQRQAQRQQQPMGIEQLRNQRATANADNTGTGNDTGTDRERQAKNKGWYRQPQFEYRQDGSIKITPNTDATGKWWNEWESKGKRNLWEQFPTQSPVCSGDDGLPSELDGITFSKWRNESIKAYGNAIVPQVAYQIFKTIQKMEEL